MEEEKKIDPVFAEMHHMLSEKIEDEEEVWPENEKLYNRVLNRFFATNVAILEFKRALIGYRGLPRNTRNNKRLLEIKNSLKAQWPDTEDTIDFVFDSIEKDRDNGK